MIDRRITEELPQTISDFLADRTAVNAIDLHIRVVGQSLHRVSNAFGLKPQAPDQRNRGKSVSPDGRQSGATAIILIQMERNYSAT
jgi:hypothetical protein